MTQGEVPTPFPSRLPAPTLDSGTSDIARRLLPFRGGFPQSWGTWGTKLPPQGGYRLLNLPSYAFPHSAARLFDAAGGWVAGWREPERADQARAGVEPKAYHATGSAASGIVQGRGRAELQAVST